MKLVAAYGSYKGTGTLILDTETNEIVSVTGQILTKVPVPQTKPRDSVTGQWAEGKDTPLQISGFSAAKGALKMEIQLLVSLSDGSVMRGYGMFKKPWKQTRPWRRYLV